MEITIDIRDRETGEIREERVFGKRGLTRLYHSVPGRLLTNLLLRREPVSRFYGWLQRRPNSKGKIAEFVDRLGIDTNEIEKPLEEYSSLDEFFTRRLKPDSRPVDTNPDHLISPADGRLLVYPRLETGELAVKNTHVSLDQLLGDRALAREYRGGAAVVARLSPADYHRFHFVDHGQASPTWSLGRGLHSVHPIALEAGAPSFQNKRAIMRLESSGFGSLLMIDVGALFVGDIIQTYRPGRVERGQEKGYFRFGGSTVIVLAQADRVRLDEDLIEASKDGLETYVKWGTRIGCRA